MLDRITGNVFTVGQGSNTSSQSVENYMKSMGGVNSGLDWKPVEPEDNIQTGVEATGDYYNQIRSLNDMGMALAAKGIDPMRVNPRDPKSVAASRQFQDQLSKVRSSAAGLITGQRVAEEYTKHRLKKNVYGKGFGGGEGGMATTEDLKNLVNTHPYTTALKGIVKETNDNFSKSYDTEVEAQDANFEIELRRKKIDEMRPALLESEMPPAMVDMLIESTKSELGKATFDPMAGKEFDLKARKTNSDINKNNEAIRKSKAGRGQEAYSELYKKVVALNNNEGWSEFDPWPNPFGDKPLTTGGYDDLFKGQKVGESVALGVGHNGERAVVYLAPSEKDFDITEFDKEEIAEKLESGEITTRVLDNNFLRDALGVSEYGKYVSAAKDGTNDRGNIVDTEERTKSAKAPSKKMSKEKKRDMRVKLWEVAKQKLGREPNSEEWKALRKSNGLL